ncbi:hypothetical protein OOJ91_09760 [Micromonospora lupini]|uniref:hypothetical protein n=1 Tax=Micromonospora lupini TaxID=285679 RepID=UPI002259D170|nr:hypothetical protein [Micromonospora lupini]MCX5066163.1 hypothetical protein [Micromonospora lupini]
MKPPSKLCTTRYRPLTAGGRCGDRVDGRAKVGATVGPTTGGRDTAGVLGGNPLARGDSPGALSGSGVDDVSDGTTGACGNGNPAGGGPSSDAGLRPRYAPRATKSRTSITTRPAHATIHGDDAMAAGPCDDRGARRMPDMYLPQRAVRAA